ncbi:TauD/TfdA dioxygenase family protein [Bradyrhizobium canariense]|uniref:TauD/TfdA dioxygenase family protein n=1 Tax=Bradyrhizobium canariense TaxID=255045 RepID=UPI0013747256|nr:TauD/TfdA family dioxygenase [Bradyrhizobium canariense]
MNVRLSAEISQDVLCAIRQLVREHKVIFFRDQKHLDHVGHERFVAMLGQAIGSDDDSSASITAHVAPGLSLQRSAAIAPGGREAAWSNMGAAYLDLPLPLRKLVDDLWATHGNDFAEAGDSGAAEANTKAPEEWLVQTKREIGHPVVRIHPETGERILALGNVGARFVGLQEDTGEKLFRLLQSYITAPENAVRWNWKLGDIAIWDNRAAQYYAIDDKQNGATSRDNLARDLPSSVNGRGRRRANAPRPQAARAA